MAKLLGLLVIVAIILLAILMAWPRDPSPAQQYLDFQRAEIQAAEEQADAARWRAFWDVALPVGGTLVLATGVGLLVMGFIALWERHRPLVNVGALPVDRRALHQGVYDPLIYGMATGQALAAVEAARRGGTPAHFTYSPHETHPARLDQANARQMTQTLPAPFTVPTIAEAAERGAFRDGRYILGYQIRDGQPVTLEQAEGRSLLIAGQGGSGGTTYLLASALQEILMPHYLPGQDDSARFILVDYHARKPGSLTERAAGLGDRIIQAAYTPAEVGAAVAAFERECRARIAGQSARYPLVMIVDEVGNMVDDEDYTHVIPDLLKAFRHANNAYRAVGGKAIVRGHTLQASAWGNSAAVRQSFHARAGMRLDEGAATLLGIKPAVAREMIALPAGQTFVTGPGLPLTHAVASNVGKDCVARVLDLAGYQAKARTVHPMPDGSLGSQREAWEAPEASTPDPLNSRKFEECGSQEASDQASDMEAERAYALFMEGHDMHKIVQALRGQDTNGRRGQVANHEIQQMIRDEIARQAG